MLRLACGLRAIGIAAVVALAVSGCARDDSNRDVVMGPDERVTDVALAGPDIERLPTGSGSSDRLVLVAKVPGGTDNLARATGDFPSWFAECCFDFTGSERNASQDPRAPALVDEDAGASFVTNFDPAGWEVFVDPPEQVHDWFMEFTDLAPNAVYVVGLVRYGLQVRGEPDALAAWLNQPFDQPDTLFLLGGTQGGSAQRPGDLFNCDLCGGSGDPYPSEPNANPFLFGFAVTDGAGTVVFDAVISACTEVGEVGDGDACVSSTPVTYTDEASRTQGNSPVAPNDFVTFDFPNYNYLVVWEADALRDPVEDTVLHLSVTPRFDRPVVRVQLGVDLDVVGAPIADGYAPFPTFADGQTTLSVPAGIRVSTLNFEVTTLEALAGGAAYKLWLYNDVTGASVPAVGNYEALDGSTVVESKTGSSVFTGGDAGLSHVWEVTDVTSTDSIGLYTHLLMTIESDTTVSTPGTARVLWYTMSDQASTATDFSDDEVLLDGSVLFGTFEERRLYAVSGSGLGSVFGDEFRVNFENLPRPPLGYQYVGWLVSGTASLRLPDESFTSPPREYTPLTDADESAVSDVVTGTTILAATQRICAVAGVANCFGPVDFRAFEEYRLLLEPKVGGPGAAPSVVLQGSLP